MRIGDIASVAGVSVRTLHHYDEIGLLRPSGRTSASHRDYTDGDVVVLYRILALRQLGLALEDIKAVLAGSDLRDTIQRQLDNAESQFRAWGRLRKLLGRLLDANPTIHDLTETMEAMTMVEKHYTPEQLEFIRKNAERQSPAIRRAVAMSVTAAVQAEWAGLSAKMQAHMEAGTDPSDPEVQALGARWRELVEMIGGDPGGVTRSLGNVYAEDRQRPQNERQFTWHTPELMDYVKRAGAFTRPPEPDS